MDLSRLICPWINILLWQLRARTKCGFSRISLDFHSECNELGLISTRVTTFTAWQVSSENYVGACVMLVFI